MTPVRIRVLDIDGPRAAGDSQDQGMGQQRPQQKVIIGNPPHKDDPQNNPGHGAQGRSAGDPQQERLGQGIAHRAGKTTPPMDRDQPTVPARMTRGRWDPGRGLSGRPDSGREAGGPAGRGIPDSSQGEFDGQGPQEEQGQNGQGP